MPEQVITYQVTRATRNSEDALSYTLKRAGSRQAYFMRLEDDWTIDGELPHQAFLISLQGLANGNGPNLYFIYPREMGLPLHARACSISCRTTRLYTFRELRTPEQALDDFPRSRSRLCGLGQGRPHLPDRGLHRRRPGDRAVVVSEELIPLAEKAGLKPVADLRGRFTGQSDVEIYRWAKEQYWERCSKEYIVWLGGEHGNIMKPGVADWGMHKQAFFNDLCANETIPEEYRLTRRAPVGDEAVRVGLRLALL